MNEDLYQLYVVEQKGTREIGKILGVSQPTARKILMREGIPLRTYKENKLPTPRGGHLSSKHRKAISDASIGKSMDYQPGDNPRWLQQEVACEGCGRLVWKKRCHLKQKHHFCSRECHARWGRKQGKKHHAYKGGPVRLSCAWCKKRQYRPRWQAKQERIFCDQECTGQWKAVNLVGDKVYNYKGGSVPNYGPSWRRARRDARRRDKYKCQRCGIKQADLGRALDVHHIRPFREFGLKRHIEANALSNLKSYCNKCHKMVEAEYDEN